MRVTRAFVPARHRHSVIGIDVVGREQRCERREDPDKRQHVFCIMSERATERAGATGAKIVEVELRNQPAREIVRAIELQQAPFSLGEAAAGHAVLVEATNRVQQVEVRQRAERRRQPRHRQARLDERNVEGAPVVRHEALEARGVGGEHRQHRLLVRQVGEEVLAHAEGERLARVRSLVRSEAGDHDVRASAAREASRLDIEERQSGGMRHSFRAQQHAQPLRCGVERCAERQRAVKMVEREPLVADEDGAVLGLVPVATEDLPDGWQFRRERRCLRAEPRLRGDDGVKAIAERWWGWCGDHWGSASSLAMAMVRLFATPPHPPRAGKPAHGVRADSPCPHREATWASPTRRPRVGTRVRAFTTARAAT